MLENIILMSFLLDITHDDTLAADIESLRSLLMTLRSFVFHRSTLVKLYCSPLLPLASSQKWPSCTSPINLNYLLLLNSLLEDMALAIGRAEAEYAEASARPSQPQPASPNLLLVLQAWSSALQPSLVALEATAPPALEELRRVYLCAP